MFGDTFIHTVAYWLNAHPLIQILIIAWVLTWKGLALWKSAGLRQKYWFMIFLVLNTFGILEIVYLAFISKKYKVEIVEQ